MRAQHSDEVRLQAGRQAVLGGLLCMRCSCSPLRLWRALASAAMGRREPTEPRRILLDQVLGHREPPAPDAGREKSELRRRYPDAELMPPDPEGRTPKVSPAAFGTFDRRADCSTSTGAGWSTLADLGSCGILLLFKRLRRERFDRRLRLRVLHAVLRRRVLPGRRAPSLTGSLADRVARRLPRLAARALQPLLARRAQLPRAGRREKRRPTSAQADELTPFPIDARDDRGQRGASAAASTVRSSRPGRVPTAVLNPNAGQLSLERRWPRASASSSWPSRARAGGRGAVVV